MPTITHTNLAAFGRAIFEAAGVPPEQAKILTDHLVESNLVGHDSHGVMHIPGYVRQFLAGNMQPVGSYKVVRETPTTMVIDANRNIGIVLAYETMQMAIERAQTYSLGAVAVHQATHIGRLGAFPPLAAAKDCIGILMLNGGGRFTAPFGGTQRRLPPNPISISVPTLEGPPMMLDMTTSMVAGGKVAVAAARNQQVPNDWLIDEEGNAVLDPARFSEVAMLPMGGSVGHKGYGLAMMIDAIAGGLSWAGCSAESPTRGGSGFLALAIKIESFIDLDDYKREIQILIDWVKSSPTMPGVKQIYYPGEIENEKRRKFEAEGITIEDSTWQKLGAIAEELNVPQPTLS